MLTDAPITPLIVPVGGSARDGAQSVKIQLLTSTPQEVRTAGFGLVTAMSVQPGDRITAGQRIMTIDDRTRIAFVADAPLWRDISIGMRGDDVASIQKLLAKLGYEPGSSTGIVTPATVTGIQALNRDLRSRDRLSTLARDSVVWIGPKPLRVAEVAVRVGDTTTSGQVILRGPAMPASVKVSELQPLGPTDSGYLLAVAGAEVPYLPGSGQVTQPADVAVIAKAMHGQIEGTGIIRLSVPVEVGTIPVTAIVTDAVGRTCVFPDVTGEPISVEAIGGSLSVAEVPPAWIGRSVLANPRDVRRDLSCG